MATTATSKSTSVLTLDELALLAMSSPSHIRPEEKDEPIIITTKDAYLWAVLFSQLASTARNDAPEWFLNKYRGILRGYRELLQDIRYPQASPWQELTNTGLNLFMDTAEACDMDPKDLVRRAETAYRSLLNKGLIKDPFKKRLASFVLAVVGLVPIGFTSTTEKGGAYIKEVHAVTWSYEDKMDKDRKETKKVEIRLLKIIKVLQPKIVEAFDEILGDEKTAKK